MQGWQSASGVPGLYPAGTIPVPGGAASDFDDPAMRWLLAVGRSGWAIAAGYLGLLAILAVPAPFALITGLVAIRDIRVHPEKHGMGRAVFGVVMGAAGSILLLIWVVASINSGS